MELPRQFPRHSPTAPRASAAGADAAPNDDIGDGGDGVELVERGAAAAPLAPLGGLDEASTGASAGATTDARPVPTQLCTTTVRFLRFRVEGLGFRV